MGAVYKRSTKGRARFDRVPHMAIDVRQYEGKKVKATIKTASTDTSVVGVLSLTLGGAIIGAVHVANVKYIVSIDEVK